MSKIKVYNVDGGELGSTTSSRARRWLKSGFAIRTKDNLGRFAVMVTDYQIKTREELDIKDIDLKKCFGIDQLDNPIVEYATTLLRKETSTSPVAESLMQIYDPISPAFIVAVNKKGIIRHIPMKEEYTKDVDYFLDEEDAEKYSANAYVIARRGALPDTVVSSKTLNAEIDMDKLLEGVISKDDIQITIPSFQIACHPSYRISEILSKRDGGDFVNQALEGMARAIRREIEINVVNAITAASDSVGADVKGQVTVENMKKSYTSLDSVRNIIISEKIYKREFEGKTFRDKNIVLNDVSDYFTYYDPCAYPSVPIVKGSNVTTNDKKKKQESILIKSVVAGTFYGANLIVAPSMWQKAIFIGPENKSGVYAIKQKPMCLVENDYRKLRVGILSAIEIGVMMTGKHICTLSESEN